MKKNIALFLLPLLMLAIDLQSVYAQLDHSCMNFQAVIRDTIGNVYTNQPFTMKLHMLNTTSDTTGTGVGNIVYSEIHVSESDKLGHCVLHLGCGAPLLGNYADIEWQAQDYWVMIEVKLSGWADFELMGKRPLMKGPFASSGLPELPDSLNNGKIIGITSILGGSEGMPLVRGNQWNMVTGTMYKTIENMFDYANDPEPGNEREYYLGLRYTDDLDTCGVSQWRFYFPLSEVRGHEFYHTYVWGEKDASDIRWTKVPNCAAQTNFENKYWRLEAKISEACQNAWREILVKDVVLMAIDRPNGTQPDVNLSNDIEEAIVSDVLIGSDLGDFVARNENGGYMRFGIADGGIQISSGNDDISYIDFTGINNSSQDYMGRVLHEDGEGFIIISEGASLPLQVIGGTRFYGQALIDLSNQPPGSAQRDCLYLIAGSNEVTTAIVTNKPTVSLYSSDLNASAGLHCGELVAHGKTTTNCLEIVGGCDIVENFDIQDSIIKPLPGHIVCLNPDNSNEYVVSSKAYNRNVIGIISGANGINPGLELKQEDISLDGKYPVAFVGRVYVKADESVNGKIMPGDLLTTSHLPGNAMKVKNRRKAHGAIIGKALSGIDENGYVMVLVGLQ